MRTTSCVGAVCESASARLDRGQAGRLLGLQVNREKTRVLDLRQPGQSLTFWATRFGRTGDQYGRPQRYWNLAPSRKAVARERRRCGG